jgi:hypothetical protein
MTLLHSETLKLIDAMLSDVYVVLCYVRQQYPVCNSFTLVPKRCKNNILEEASAL